jgi:mRNA interferase RelE/StbE
MTHRDPEGPSRVILAPPAQRQLRRLPPAVAARARAPILALADDPRPAGAARVQGSDFLRVRSGDLRVVYSIDDVAREVVVLRVARRSESTYRRIR